MENRNAKYNPGISVSPYTKVNLDRIDKEDHKTMVRTALDKLDTEKELSVVDVGCGNGELLAAFQRSFPHWKYWGYDMVPEFVETAKKFPGLEEATLEVRDFMDVDGEYDLCTCTSVLQIFPDIEERLDKLLTLVKPGGYVFGDGLFNKYSVEVCMQYQDRYHPEYSGKWSTDWHQHSRRRISDHLDGKVADFEFHDMVMDVDIPHDPEKPSNYTFTFRAADGRNILTNGLNIIKNKTLLVIRK